MWLIGALAFLSVFLMWAAVRDVPSAKEEKLRHVFGPGPGDEAGAGAAEPELAEEEKRSRGILARWEAEARAAGLQATAVRLLGLSAVTGLFGAAVAYSIFPRWYVTLVGVLLGLAAPRWLVNRAKRARSEAFSKALDGALGKLASYLRAGRSLEQAIQLGAGEMDEPARTELQRAGRAIGLGATAAEALAGILDRVDSRDFELVVVAVSILTRTGGNLAEVLQKIAQQVQERRLTRQAILAATAQVRVTAYVVSAMPFAMTLLLRILNPEYFGPMMQSPTGQMVMVACYGAVAVAWLWIRRILDVEVD